MSCRVFLFSNAGDRNVLDTFSNSSGISHENRQSHNDGKNLPRPATLICIQREIVKIHCAHRRVSHRFFDSFVNCRLMLPSSPAAASFCQFPSTDTWNSNCAKKRTTICLIVKKEETSHPKFLFNQIVFLYFFSRFLHTIKDSADVKRGRVCKDA